MKIRLKERQGHGQKWHVLNTETKYIVTTLRDKGGEIEYCDKRKCFILTHLSENQSALSARLVSDLATKGVLEFVR